ncbi:MAG: HopJ type III effector protein [Spongiibacteraceae bacterium]|nr:HopJ type III effector protein [Spongiibacteraceae bacterium]MBN4055437.1 HopJ type III effector protein [bacterium AH-315-K03]
MTLELFISQLKTNPESIDFETLITLVDTLYVFTPTEFVNNGLVNKAGENNGSCKIFAFAQLHHLTKAQTLYCFGRFYREEVLQHPEGDNHQNIRTLMASGEALAGVKFKGVVLTLK